MSNTLIVGWAMMGVGALLVAGGVWLMRQTPAGDNAGAQTVVIGFGLTLLGIGVCIGGGLR